MKTFLIFSVFLSALCGSSIAAEPPRPNILIILADDLKHHDLGFTGCEDIPTPHIDALCARSTHFTQAYCTAPLCAPSRAGLLTGRNQARFGFDFNPEPYVAEDQGNRLAHPDRLKNGLPQSEKTLAHHLQNAGYQTAWIGKWHLGEAEWAQPRNHGFQHCYGFLPGVQSYFPMTAAEAKRAGDVPPLHHSLLDNGMWVKNTSNITAMLGTEAARYIAAAKEEPWFMYLAFNAPHGPHQPDPDLEPKFGHITNAARRKLACTLSRLDDAVGTVMQSLDTSGQRQRTLVFFINDHGAGAIREWGGGKGTMLEGGLRSLLFASWPGHLAEKTERHDRVTFLDIAPTALKAAGVEITPSMKLEGTDLLTESPIPNRPLAWRMDEAFAYRDEGDWKLVGNASKTTLHDLKADPRERTDLSAKHPEKLAELLTRWRAWDRENARPMWRSVAEGAKKPGGAENRSEREAKAAPPSAKATTPGSAKGALVDLDAAQIAEHQPHSSLDLHTADDFSFSATFTLHSLADATLFEWSSPPADKAGRHFVALELIKPSNMPVPLLGAYVDGSFICGPADKLADGKPHTALFRSTAGKKQFFLDGVLQESQGGGKAAFNPNFDLIQRMARTSDALISRSGLVIGSDLRGRHAFTGKLDRLTFWNRALPDDETDALRSSEPVSSHWPNQPGYYEVGGRFYDPHLSLPQRFDAILKDYQAHYRRSLAENRYFPRVHVTIPGFITEPSTCFHNGSFHLWPHGHIEWGTNPTHLFQHLISRDLVHWSYQPLPGWTYARACNIAVLPGGAGVTYANNSHRKNQDGTWTLGLQKWVSSSPDLLAWEKEGDIPLPAPTTGTPTLDHWIFKYNDQWHMIAASPGTQPVPGKQPTLELYRTTDPRLSSWTYVGPFYTGTHSAHHPKIFLIGGKAVIFSDIAIDAGSQYLIGRIENDRFIKEGEGSFHLDETDANPFGGVITTETGRNVLFFWMRDTLWHADHTARDAMREGWLSAYSLPRDITLAPDGQTLLFHPAKELAALREKELHDAESLSLTATPVLLTAPHDGAFELQTTLDLHQSSTAMLTLAAAKNDHLTLTCDANGQLTLELKNAPRAARNVPQRQPATGHISLRDGRYADLRLIWDHSLLEVYANGRCLTAWWRPDDPQAVTATLHATKGNVTATQVKCWSLSTIWKDFTPAVAKTGETAAVTATPALPAQVQSIALRFTAPGKGWTGTLLSRRAPPGEASWCVTAFKHEPFGKRYLGVAMDGIGDGPNQAAARTVRDNVVGGHLVCAFTEMDATLDGGTHDLVFRTDGKTAELFIDGVRRESRSAERFTARTFLKLYPHHPIGEKQGSDPSGGDAFTGKLEDVKCFAHALSDDEIKTLSRGRLETPAAPPTSQKGYCTALFDPAATEEERMRATDEAMSRWLAAKLAKDVWFPRFHAALPAGMMFDTRCAIHGGRYHLYPTWRPDMNLTSGTSGAFRMQHLSSSDLIHWRIEPVPMRFPDRDVCNGTPAMLDGKPQFFFLRYSRDGAPHRALPTDDTLTAWTLPETQPSIVKEGAGYSGRLDSVVFQDSGKYYLTGTRRNTAKTSMAMPLYRSEDLTSWSYIGDFYQTDTKPFNECPQIFHVGGKMVVAAFYPLRGRHENYLVGRFENEKFIPEAGGQWDHGGHAHDRSFDAETSPDGRVIGWSTLSVYAEADALDVARQGWKGMHSIPKEVTLRPDNTLALHPAREMEQLRSEKHTTLPAGHDGQFEIEITFTASETLTFNTPDGSCVLSYDAGTRMLTFDMSKSPKLGSDHAHIFRTPPLQNPTARLFFDRSVFEVFADGHVLTSRYFSLAPEKMTLKTSAPIQAWKVGTIWK